VRGEIRGAEFGAGGGGLNPSSGGAVW